MLKYISNLNELSLEHIKDSLISKKEFYTHGKLSHYGLWKFSFVISKEDSYFALCANQLFLRILDLENPKIIYYIGIQSDEIMYLPIVAKRELEKFLCREEEKQ